MITPCPGMASCTFSGLGQLANAEKSIIGKPRISAVPKYRCKCMQTPTIMRKRKDLMYFTGKRLSKHKVQVVTVHVLHSSAQQ